MFLKKKSFENWTSRGVNSGVMQFHTQFTPVSRQFFAFSKKKSLGKTVWKSGLRFVVKLVYYSKKLPWKKSAKK